MISWVSNLDIQFALLGLSTELSTILLAALTAFATAVVAAPVRLAVDKRLQRSQVEVEYDHEQRMQLRAKVGKYHGRLLEAALDLNYRLVNLSNNSQEGWLDVGGDYRQTRGTQHYFRTMVFRFVRLVGLAIKFEREAIVVDNRIAEGTDEAFVRYPKAFRWAMTDAALFKGLEYDYSRSRDHFFTDQLRHLCSVVWGSREEIEFSEFEELVIDGPGLDDLLEFFDGLKPAQLRWDRLMVLRLFLMAFINTFGHDYQASDDESFDDVLGQIHHVEIVKTLQPWIQKLGLGRDPGTERLAKAVERRCEGA